MPEHLRALIVILLLAAIVFSLVKGPASQITKNENFSRLRNFWFVLTLVAFLSQSFWLYASISGLLMLLAVPRSQNVTALFFLLLFLIPPASVDIPGLGFINYLFSLNHTRLLELTLLLPAALHLINKRETSAFGKTAPDKFLALYLLLIATLQLRDKSFTDAIRQSFYLSIDIFLPYYVVSRSLDTIQKFKEASLGFVIASLILALIGCFEFLRHWLLYNALIPAMGMTWDLSNYLNRGDFLRASATTGQAIVLGLVMVVALGCYQFIQPYIRSAASRRLGMLLLVAGLIAPLSRGPWIGALILLIMFILTGQHATKKLTLLAITALCALPLVAIMPGGEKVINMLPFIGKTENENITYRQNLIDVSIVVIERNPWFGSPNYQETPEMEAMRQGQGIIDVVNTYLQVALQSGVVGLGLFSSFFVAILIGIRRRLRTAASLDGEEYLLGRVLFCTLISVLVIIFTVSSISFIPVVYWSLAGMGVAFIQMTMKVRKQA